MAMHSSLNYLAVVAVALQIATPAIADERFRAEVKGLGGATCANLLGDNSPGRDTMMLGYAWGSLATASFYEASNGREIRQPRATDVMTEIYARCEDEPFLMVAEVMNGILAELGGSLTPAGINE